MKNTMLWTGCFSYIWFVPISRILYQLYKCFWHIRLAIDIYLGPQLLLDSSDSDSLIN